MNKEEKQAIDDLKLAIEQDKEELPYSKESLKNKQGLLNYIDKLQKENERNIRILNETEKIMNGQERTKDKLLKENVELQKENEDMREELQMYVDTPINKLIVENEELQKENEELKENNENLKECVISWQSAFKLIENQNIKLINEYLKNG